MAHQQPRVVVVGGAPAQVVYAQPGQNVHVQHVYQPAPPLITRETEQAIVKTGAAIAKGAWSVTKALAKEVDRAIAPRQVTAVYTVPGPVQQQQPPPPPPQQQQQGKQVYYPQQPPQQQPPQQQPPQQQPHYAPQQPYAHVQGPPPGGMTTMACPSCSNPFQVAAMPTPQTVACPTCQRPCLVNPTGPAAGGPPVFTGYQQSPQQYQQYQQGQQGGVPAPGAPTAPNPYVVTGGYK